MVPNLRTGRSFKGAGLYYLHDKRAEGEAVRLTADRVAWTHTHNCAADEPDLALREMFATARNQQLLKEQAGKGLGGGGDGEVVKTISLAWAPDQSPDQATMIAAGESYLKHMGWQDHQAVFVAHNDEPHPHVHIILNKVHPETGLLLNEWQDQQRSQRWALQYEKDEGQIRCEARADKYDHGKDVVSASVPHDVHKSWEQHAKDLDTMQAVHNRLDAAEWELLKQAQRDQRDEFRQETKDLIKGARFDAYREVREEFKPLWREFYELRDNPATDREQADQARQALIDAQKEATGLRQQEAAQALIDSREEARQAMLKQHRDERADLRSDQAADITRYDLLSQAYPPAVDPQPTPDRMAEFRGAAQEVANARAGPVIEEAPRAMPFGPAVVEVTASGPVDRGPSKDVSVAFAGGFLALADCIADSMSGTTPEARPDPYAATRASDEAYSQMVEANREQARQEAERWAVRDRERDRDDERDR